jgi:hypothetical protein
MALEANYTDGFGVVVRPETKAVIREAARKRHVSMAQLVRDALDAHLDLIDGRPKKRRRA